MSRIASEMGAARSIGLGLSPGDSSYADRNHIERPRQISGRVLHRLAELDCDPPLTGAIVTR